MKKKVTIFVGIISFFIGACMLYGVMYFFPMENAKTVINKSEKEVTITDEGIADAVEKIYDAVVVVENYNQNGLKKGSGTGFVYKKEKDKAYILTNNHVVNGASKVSVIFPNKDKVEVEILGSDQYFDLAILTIDPKYVTQVAEIGSSEDLRLGDTVFTVGAPLDNAYSGSVTRGIISGKDRLVPVSTSNLFGNDYMMRVIQTDASINSGNSGGPLSNSNGEVIGITSLKLMSIGVEGIGFAIPIEDAIDFANVIESGEKIVRPSLGVRIYDVSQNKFANNFDLDDKITTGAVISSVDENSSAGKSGLKPGDVIIKIDDHVIDSVSSLKYYLYRYKVGDAPNFKVNRNGKELSIKVKLDKALQ